MAHTQDNPLRPISEGIADSILKRIPFGRWFEESYMSIKTLVMKKRWAERGEWPVKLSGVVLKATNYLNHAREIEVRVSVLPNTKVYLGRLAVIKSASIMELDVWLHDILHSGIIPQVEINKTIGKLGDYELVAIDKIISKAYHITTATFRVPCLIDEKLSLRLVAIGHLKGDWWKVVSNIILDEV